METKKIEEKEIDLPNDTLVLDVASMPEGWNIDKWMDIMKTHGVCIIDSFKNSNTQPIVPPYMLQPRRKMKYTVIEHSVIPPGELDKFLKKK